MQTQKHFEIAIFDTTINMTTPQQFGLWKHGDNYIGYELGTNTFIGYIYFKIQHDIQSYAFYTKHL